MPFPSPPWQLRGTLWVSLFAVTAGTSDRPAGLYGAAFVDYAEGSVLTYHELVVARLVRERTALRVHVTDIWVDSPASRDGGRSLWAIPKELAELHVRSQPAGPVRRTSWEASSSGRPVSTARFTCARVPSLRTPYAFTVSQPREDGSRVLARVAGTSRNLPMRARWDFGADGPLAWLRGRPSLGSVVVGDFRMSFGA